MYHVPNILVIGEELANMCKEMNDEGLDVLAEEYYELIDDLDDVQRYITRLNDQEAELELSISNTVKRMKAVLATYEPNPDGRLRDSRDPLQLSICVNY